MSYQDRAPLTPMLKLTSRHHSNCEDIFLCKLKQSGKFFSAFFVFVPQVAGVRLTQRWRQLCTSRPLAVAQFPPTVEEALAVIIVAISIAVAEK